MKVPLLAFARKKLILTDTLEMGFMTAIFAGRGRFAQASVHFSLLPGPDIRPPLYPF